MKPYTLGLYEKSMPTELTWREKLEAARESGYDFVEMSVDETDDKLKRLEMPKKARVELVKTMVEAGIPIRTMCLSGHRKYPIGSADEQVRRRGMEIMEKAIELAEDLGIRIIQLAGYDVYYEDSTAETRALFAENLKQAVMLAASAGVVLGFETMETEFMNTVAKAMEHVTKINSSYLNVYPDAGNIKNAAFSYGTDELEDLKCGAGHIVAMHLKETVPGKFREIPFGTGHVNFKEMIHTAWQLGVRKYVTEFWYTGNTKWRQELSSTRVMISELLDRECCAGVQGG